MNVYFRVLIQKQNIRNKVMKKLKRVTFQKRNGQDYKLRPRDWAQRRYSLMTRRS